ncbi:MULTISPECIES: DUF1240 domain-containing protein [Citrobacter]|uniref:DUF1240 domain-containing protein n=1 Tax=Citrobacter portucalensis TaxID=1639133 RepID=A0AAW9EK22_9ENTR|nr:MULTISPECIES: DUF1240 domain-containing protein [Citrobacter]ETX61431.1 hypothetical protein P835_04120 [Citrobacter portucalensis]MDE9703238.1 DUF1240 domain-containing protein [Citrobacter portucalensis]MDM2771788.1 DUF1240 domain-containing protein [Citrobacter sp. Cpo126]MDM2857593.1 DUF1240 domain-containing protein [Citrobacter sp. Cpo071]MDX6975487.1 DUF1240 domain-containing protein [Citrobacter portucalensis]
MAEIIDMKHNINLVNIKKRCNLFLCIFIFGGGTWVEYIASVPDLTDLIESRSIVYFFWGSFCMFFMIPVTGCFTLGTAYLAFAKSMQPPKFFDRTFTIVFHVAGVGFVIGTILSFIVIFYPLGTNYVLCERPGPTSGTYYTRTEEICEQVKHLRKTRASKDIPKLKDQLDGILPP